MLEGAWREIAGLTPTALRRTWEQDDISGDDGSRDSSSDEYEELWGFLEGCMKNKCYGYWWCKEVFFF